MSQPKILYVEDHKASREMLSILFNMVMGIEDITLFEDTHNFDARLAASTKSFDIAFLDLNLRPIDGFQACIILRQQVYGETVKIIGLTAHVETEIRLRMQETGFDGLISKPLSHRTFPIQFERIMSGESVWEVE